jgi:hypothetical protein
MSMMRMPSNGLLPSSVRASVARPGGADRDGALGDLAWPRPRPSAVRYVRNFGPNPGNDYGGRLIAAWLDR